MYNREMDTGEMGVLWDYLSTPKRAKLSSYVANKTKG